MGWAMRKPIGKKRDAPVDENGAKDKTAPVKGAQLAGVDWNVLLQTMSKRDRERLSSQMASTHPNLRQAKRDGVRRWLTFMLVLAVIADGVLALILAVADVISWADLRDWLTLAVVPLTTGLAIVLAFWFPAKGE